MFCYRNEISILLSDNKSDVSSKTELSIVAPPMFVTDESGTREFISTCRPLEGTRIMWDGVTCSHTDAKDGSCTFTPKVEDDGKMITCSAKDVVSGLVVSQASFTLQLNCKHFLYIHSLAPLLCFIS